ncbi:DNA-directed RNA polymerase subunit beta' [candidate division Kazan bacterium]|uniref:DNA-directed RNA polymerase subunit beta' n=1 Tax=candidate division Kazan bacterium TaxID=2202143 RepID=A0A420ZE99_UNCK3|nr:MAG: DNA-directed RNA polymerase subunit beta' [candidate division Kazan bacterium]
MLKAKTSEAQNDFLAVRIGLASPEQILSWSHGEVTKPETINYRTLRPEKEGLFDERIFGPTKDWECYCGKYKKIRYKGIVCDKCGVEVTRSLVRRERMGHIQLSTPVSHIWYLRGTPSRLGLVLDVPARKLESVIYFAAYIVNSVDENMRAEALRQLEQEYKSHVKNIKNEYKQKKTISAAELEEKLIKLKAAYQTATSEVKDLKVKKIISEHEYRDLSLKYGQVFKAGIGAEAIYQMIKDIDLDEEDKKIRTLLKKATGQKYKRLQKRLRLIEGFIRAKLHPSWMLITVLPVIPPDLRPMVQLDGGRFATSDLNDLYRRVINRNNRLKKLINIGAPEVITRNEKRMLQEAVDALFDITARETSATTNVKRQLKSLSDLLKGKQGRFRQNLLGKRVDYSGRSVIVVGPTLKLDECGIPKPIALELFKPFVIAKLLADGLVHNVKTAGKMVEKEVDEVWDALEHVINKYYVLLNRAPTLHRLGIQAFRPVLVEGNAIQLQPLSCAAFNADFDGDQMAVHLPLSEFAQREAKEIMLSTNNLLKPSTGEPIVIPNNDMVLGCYFLTLLKESTEGDKKRYFVDHNEAALAYSLGKLELHEPIHISINGEIIRTTFGRLLFNEVVPEELGFVNKAADKKTLKEIINASYRLLGREKTVKLVNGIKDIGFHYATISGATFGAGDLQAPQAKNNLIKATDKKVDDIKAQFKEGLITADERRRLVTDLWEKTKQEIEQLICSESMQDIFNPVTMMVASKARGSLEQFNQMVGIVGTKVNATGVKLELPVKSNYKEGLSSLEYFLSTHGARKGLSDTALRTSDAGYLTRRLVDVCQDIVVAEEDCKTELGIFIEHDPDNLLSDPLSKRIEGRFAAVDVKSPSGKVLVKAGEYITEDLAHKIEKAGLTRVKVRSMITCKAPWGICQKCYGQDLATGQLVKLGEAVGIVAAQSIGEPGTQLTMRTFHTGGVASTTDITQGLPRVEELFEARRPKTPAIVSPGNGTVHIMEVGNKKFIRLEVKEDSRIAISFDVGAKIKVKHNDKVKKGDVIFVADDKDKTEYKAPASGVIEIQNNDLVLHCVKSEVYEYPITKRTFLRVKDGDKIKKGQQITEGQLDPHELMVLKGAEATQAYVTSEVQNIYAMQGQNINDKHIEAVVRQMFSKYRIDKEGDSPWVAGEMVDRLRLEKAAAELVKNHKRPPSATQLLLGISKAALNTESFLSAASFQETTRVLVDAAVSGKVDFLRGLKENVIVGRLIPAGTGFATRQIHKLDTTR